MTEVPMCPVCTVRPCKVRTNGRSLGRCDECIRAGSAAVGTVREVRPGKFRVKRADGSWVASDKNGRELGEFVSGRLEDIMAKYRLVPAPAQLAATVAVGVGGARLAPDAAAMSGLPVAAGPVARASDPWTSHAAGRQAADPANLTAAQAKVLRGLSFGPGTDCDVARRMAMHLGSAAKRRLDLLRAELVEPWEEMTAHGPLQATRLTEYGRPALVWQITPWGARVLELHEAKLRAEAS